jgi:hypothetical protein
VLSLAPYVHFSLPLRNLEPVGNETLFKVLAIARNSGSDDRALLWYERLVSSSLAIPLNGIYSRALENDISCRRHGTFCLLRMGSVIWIRVYLYQKVVSLRCSASILPEPFLCVDVLYPGAAPLATRPTMRPTRVAGI